MAGWRKAWLSVMDRGGFGGGGGGGGGGSSSSLLGLLSPSSSSSSLTGYKRGGAGGRYYGGGGHQLSGGKAVLGCFSVALVLAFFYVSVTNSPTADDSFPSPMAASASSGAILPWLSANASTLALPTRKSLPPHPPIPPTVSTTTTGAGAAQRSGARRNVTVGPRRAEGDEEEDSAAPAEDLAMPTSLPLPQQTIGNATVGSMDITTPPQQQEPQDGTATTPMPRWRRAHGASSSSSSHDEKRRKETTTTILTAVQDEGAAAEHRDGGGGGAVNATAAVAMAVGPGDNRVVWTSGLQKLVSFARCDVFSGGWVKDDKSYPLYPPGSCPHIDDDFNCHKNGRPDSGFLRWRWQPRGCDIPRLNRADFLERLRGQRIIFVGDSLNRNMWESLVCILRQGVKNKKSIYEASGRNQFKTRGYYSFKFRDYNCSVDFIRSIFLVKELVRETKKGADTKLKLDELDDATPAYRTADIVVFNTGHWWTHSKTSRGLNYYQEGSHVYPSLDVMDAFKKGLTTWARWIDKNIDSRRTQVVFRGYSLTHFRGGQWNSGGRCHRETEPIFNQTYLTEYPEKMKILEQVLRQMKTPVIYLNISTLTDYRKDGHPSLYRVRYDTEEERIAAVAKQDCSHWCLPGVPDTWNELLYASLLQAGKGSWRL